MTSKKNIKKVKKETKQDKLIKILKESPKSFEEIEIATGLSKGSINNYLTYYIQKKLNLNLQIDTSAGLARYFIEG